MTMINRVNKFTNHSLMIGTGLLVCIGDKVIWGITASYKVNMGCLAVDLLGSEGDLKSLL